MKINSIKIGPYINLLPLQYIPQHKISYVEFGDPKIKIIILCAHGLTRNAHDFDKIAKELCKNYRVISINYPGRSDSENFKKPHHYNYTTYIKDTLLFLKRLNIKNPIWLGTSMGGIIGMVLASKYKNIFKALILNDIGAFIDAAPLIKIGDHAKKIILLDDLASAKKHLKLIYAQIGIKNEEDWDYLTKYSVISTFGGKYKMNYDPAITKGMKNANNQEDVKLWSVWNKIKCRILVIHGMKSQILTKSTIQKMKKTNTFDLYEIKYAGHAPSLMNDEEINYIESWLEKSIDVL
ncbi:alpha/beta fold hydrolase [Rickettsia prowazekii]|uniref:alpha/beta fold hydrolase n=1 Tax=Rickettsia prowazekii TaxID=782 RepID=UPI0002C65579|nr:alpha/beta hydrolase [Rickettsia prowazekii]AGJ01911.1 Thioredoxin reductase [Rickettsia prowazekii str. NMRC Madrid E]